jgi:UDP-3-O-[3-hydroxymyristoyl] glucosamine N-acyltransferase
MSNKIKLTEIIDFLGNEVLAIKGNPVGVDILHLKDPQNVDEFTLDWINPLKPDKQNIAKTTKARAIIANPATSYDHDLIRQKKVLIIVESPKLAIAKIGIAFFVKKYDSGIHHSAIIDPDAVLGNNVYIGANVTIGKCTIGDNSVIHSGVIIADAVKIGKHVVIKSGAVLGQEGFGFERLKDGSLIKFPQLGGLIIEDNVEIGSNTCIDRGSLSDTIIGKGTKVNNLCHIAHNVVIGENVVITAQVNISGSTIIEDNVWVAPNATLRGHQRIGKGSVIGAGTVVTKNIPAFETWIGNPAKKLKF